MAMCPKCNNEVKYGDPEINLLDIAIEKNLATARVEIILKCAVCETEIKSFEFEDKECFEGFLKHKKLCPTLLNPTAPKFKAESWECEAYEPEAMDADDFPKDGEIHYGYEMDVTIRCEYCKAESMEDGLIFKNSAAEKHFKDLSAE